MMASPANSSRLSNRVAARIYEYKDKFELHLDKLGYHSHSPVPAKKMYGLVTNISGVSLIYTKQYTQNIWRKVEDWPHHEFVLLLMN